MKTLRRLFFWDFQRTSWQWDIIVTVILAFIFLTPRELFRDQPQAARIQKVQQGYLLDTKLLANVPEAEWPQKAAYFVNEKYKNYPTITHVTPLLDEAEGEITGYIAYTKP